MRNPTARGPFVAYGPVAARALLAICAWLSSVAQAQQAPVAQAPEQKPQELSLEALLQIEVTSASRKTQALEDVPAAIFVLTHEDLRRSGATSLPEALRLVPGMDVARLDSNRWAVSSRGFNGQFANKMLVLVDGRSVYTPLFSGVWWDEVGVPFELIERIEVIRGPGAAMWGSNAVNGVISIITRDASQTQGGELSVAAGNLDHATSFARYGDKLGDGYWRVWGEYFNRDSTELSGGVDAEDDWNMGRGGFRGDWTLSDRDTLLVSADAYQGDVHNLLQYPQPTAPFQFVGRHESDIDGWSLLSRWTRTLSDSSELQVQAYAAGEDRDTDLITEDRSNQSIDVQQRFSPIEQHEIVWGLSYHSTQADTQGSFVLTLSDNHRRDDIFAAFVQDEIELVEDLWSLTVGSKFEENDYTGWQAQPNVRLLFTPTARQSVWASVSHAVRTPSQVEDDVTLVQTFIPGAPNQVVTLFGDHELDAEQLTAYELGYRVQPTDRLSFDLATFYNDYSDLITWEQGAPFLSGGDLIVPLVATNATQGHAYGAELAAEWDVRTDTRLLAAYSYLKLEIDSTPTGPAAANQEAPQNQMSLRMQHDVNENTDLDLTLRYVDELQSGAIKDYFALDGRIEWRPSRNLAVILGAQNVFHDGAEEFGQSQFGASSQSRTAAYLKVSWSF